jgi:PAS domain-containing protein
VSIDEGTPYWQGFMLDITERKHAEEATQAAEARYRALVEQVPAAIYTQIVEEDGTTNTTFISPQAEEMLGYTVQETLTDPGMWRRMLHPDTWSASCPKTRPGTPRASPSPWSTG